MQKSTPEMDQEEAGKVKQKVMSALGPEKNKRKVVISSPGGRGLDLVNSKLKKFYSSLDKE